MGNARETYSYQRALDMSQDLRLHCCQCINTLHGHHLIHGEVSNIDRFEKIKELEASIDFNRELRFSNRMPKHRSKVSHKGEYISIQIGDTRLSIDWEDALQLSTWFRIAGQKARAWAGDATRRMRLIGLATNATPDTGPRVY